MHDHTEESAREAHRIVNESKPEFAEGCVFMWKFEFYKIIGGKLYQRNDDGHWMRPWLIPKIEEM